MPALVRGASEARFSVTNDVPAIDDAPPNRRMTGSMPLVDEQSLSGVDFALPEYDDGDFSADMEPPPDPRAVSAAGERHADEISKILAETDVYVKYGLHQKAVDHLRRVFGLDPENVEAHERLKDILISQGREQEAEVELLKLAELVAPADPDRAETYLRELLAMNGTHTGAFDLARRFRLRVARMSSVSAELDYAAQGGGVSAVDIDLEDFDLADAPRAAPVGVARSMNPGRDSVDEFDPDELLGRVAHGSPAPGRPPSPPPGLRGAPVYETDNFALEFDPHSSTRQMSPEHVEALNAIPDEDPHHATHIAAFEAVDAQLDDDALGQDIDSEVAAELAQGADDLPFDPDDARSFDAAVPKGAASAEPVYVSAYDDTDLPHPEQLASSDVAAYADGADDPLSVSGSYDPYGTEAVQTPPYDPTISHSLDTTDGHVHDPDLDDLPAEPARAETSIEDDLDEADFYAGQGMYPEAIDVLTALLAQYPNHRLIELKLREVEAMAIGEPMPMRDSQLVMPHELETPLPGEAVMTDPADLGAIDHGDLGATDHGDLGVLDSGEEAIDLDEIEEVGLDDFEELPSATEASPPQKRGPTIMLERPVDESDADTHYDLGLAYREMGLHDEAIKAFEKALRAPSREVQCRVMIGMCQRDQGNASEAIHQFKQGLHAEPQERERQSLHYEIGVTYEQIGDYSEALYYFEMVAKRDPNFADAAQRAVDLRGREVRASDNDI